MAERRHASDKDPHKDMSNEEWLKGKIKSVTGTIFGNDRLVREGGQEVEKGDNEFERQRAREKTEGKPHDGFA